MKTPRISVLKFCVLLVFLLTNGVLFAQEADPVLFTVDGNPVLTSEFVYIYNKNNTGVSDYGQSSVREYLELYKNFKLKVHHARQLKMDTIQRLNDELAGYREQLASTYLNDNSVMNRLVEEAYERMQTEAEISHILIRLPKNPLPKDTATAFEMASSIYDELVSQEADFGEIARARSQDTKNNEQGGYIGYMKAILPSGYYQLETAIYNLKPGGISKPVRSPRGYHIVQLHSTRASLPEIELAQILVKKKKKSKDHAPEKRKIADMHNRLIRGVPFEEMALKESEDQTTARKGGRIGFVSVGQYDAEFEKAIFALSENGQISEPIETRIGFHILKRLSIKEVGDLNDAKRRIENELRRTERERLAKNAMIERIKREEELRVDLNNRNKLLPRIDDGIFSYRWAKPKDISDFDLISFKNGFSKGSLDFVDYLIKNPKRRVQLKNRSKNQALLILFEEFINDACLELEKTQLEKKHPDFASLMKEYEEGILLFEITKENVWDRASSDTTGLQAFFKNNRSNYTYPENLEAITFIISDANLKSAKKIAKRIKKKSPSEIEKVYPNIPQENRQIEKGSVESEDFVWREGRISALKPIGDSGNAFLVNKTMKVNPSTLKELESCRGYVIADYQEELERTWINDLKAMYPVVENRKNIDLISK